MSRLVFEYLNDCGMNISWGPNLDDGIGLYPHQVREILTHYLWLSKELMNAKYNETNDIVDYSTPC